MTRNRFRTWCGGLTLLALVSAGCGQEVVAAPTLTVISPAEGSALGGTQLTLGGTNFESGATVSIGGAAATQVIVLSSTAIECLSPPGTPGVVDVAVTSRGGTATLEGGYTYFSTILVADGGGFVGDKNLYALDADTGEAFTVGPIGFPVTGMDFHPETGVLYGVTGSATRQLITIDPITGEGTVVGNLVDSGGNYQLIPGITFVGSVLYGTNAGEEWPASWAGGLVTIDVTSGRVDVLFENEPLGEGGGFAADATGANVYYMSFNTWPIYSVNVTTGVFTPGPILQGSAGSFDRIPGAAFHNGSLYAIESTPGEFGPSDRQLVVIDVSTGAITPIGDVYTTSAFNAIASPTREAFEVQQ